MKFKPGDLILRRYPLYLSTSAERRCVVAREYVVDGIQYLLLVGTGVTVWRSESFTPYSRLAEAIYLAAHKETT